MCVIHLRSRIPLAGFIKDFVPRPAQHQTLARLPVTGHDEPAMKGVAKKGKIRWTRGTDEILHQVKGGKASIVYRVSTIRGAGFRNHPQ